MPDNKQPQMLFTVGLPGAGKTTFLSDPENTKGYRIISIDDIKEEVRKQHNKETGENLSKDQIRYRYMDRIESLFYDRIAKTAEAGENMIIEHPHLLPAKRQSSLELAKKYGYRTMAIVIMAPEEKTHIERLVKRAFSEGRFQPLNFLSEQGGVMAPPHNGDGEFDEVIYIGENPKHPLFHEYGKKRTLSELIEEAEKLGSSPHR